MPLVTNEKPSIFNGRMFVSHFAKTGLPSDDKVPQVQYTVVVEIVERHDCQRFVKTFRQHAVLEKSSFSRQQTMWLDQTFNGRYMRGLQHELLELAMRGEKQQVDKEYGLLMYAEEVDWLYNNGAKMDVRFC